MHIALIDIPANAVSIGMVSGITNTSIPGLEILTSAVWADTRDHGTLVYIRASVILARAFRA